MTTGKEPRNLAGGPFQFHAYSVAFSPDGRHFAAGATSGRIKIWNASTGELERAMSPGNIQPYSQPVAYAHGRWLVCGSGRSVLELWDVATGGKLETLPGHHAAVEAVAVSPDGKWLASGADDDTVKRWRNAN